ncbi:MAG: hypothetical protein KF850_30300 [Labilithrix sp.]|nr:hypothetical protein [Labilithrix sp.]
MLARRARACLATVVLAAAALGEVRCVGDEPLSAGGGGGQDGGPDDATDASPAGDDAGASDGAATDDAATEGPAQHAGAPVWFPKASTPGGGPHVAVDGAGNTYLAFAFDRPTTILGSALAVSGGGFDIAVVKISPAGAVLWSRVFGGAEAETVDAIVVDASSNVFISGEFVTRTLTFGAIVSVSHAMGTGRPGIYVARLAAADGEGLAATTISGAGGAGSTHLALGTGGLALGYRALGGITVDAYPSGVESVPVVGDSWSGVVSSLDPSTLRAKWTNRFGSSSNEDGVRGVAVSSNGSVFAALRIGARPFDDWKGGPTLTDDARRDVIVRLTPGGGLRLGAVEMPESAGGSLRVGALAASSSDSVVHFTATLTGTASFGGASLASAGATDVVVGALSAGGTVTAVERHGGAGADAPTAITRRDGRTYVAATYGPGPIALEGVTLPAGAGDVGASVVFEASLTPEGSKWVRAVRGSSIVTSAVTVDPLANAVIQGGFFRGAASLGDGVTANSGDPLVYGGFLTRWKK